MSLENTLAQYQSQELSDLVTSMSQEYLPYLGVAHSTSENVLSGLAKFGDIVLTQGGNPKSLGTSVNAIVCLSQPRAQKLADGSLDITFDPKSAKFKEYAANASFDSGMSWGFDFLIYLVDEQKFASFYLQSKTNRKMAPQFQTAIGKSTVIGTKRIETAKHKWYGVTVAPATTPHAPPSDEALADAVAKFRGQGTPPAAEGDTGRAR